MMILSSGSTITLTVEPTLKFAISCEGVSVTIHKLVSPFNPSRWEKVATVTNSSYESSSVTEEVRYRFEVYGAGEAYLEKGVSPKIVSRYPDRVSIGKIPAEKASGIDVSGDISTEADLTVGGDAEVDGDLIVHQNFEIEGNVTITGDLTADEVMATGVTTGTIDVTGAAQFDSTVTITQSPSSSTDAVNKSYADSLAQNAKRKENCLVATTENIILSGEQMVDGVLTSASRVLVWQQTDPVENGIYVSNADAWVRSDDANTGEEIVGALIFVLQGVSYSGRNFNNSNSTPPVVGTDDITFVNLGASVVHNSTQGLQGGSPDEYYHLTSAQHTSLEAIVSGGYAEAMDQGVSTTSSPIFRDVEVLQNSTLASFIGNYGASSKTPNNTEYARFVGRGRDTSINNRNGGALVFKTQTVLADALPTELLVKLTISNSNQLRDVVRYTPDGEVYLLLGNLNLVTTKGVYVNGTRVLTDQQPVVAYPTGGAVVDAECRTQLNAVIDSLRNMGIQASS